MKAPDIGNMDEARRGMIYGVLAYGWWGLMPIFFRALEPASPLEILSHRILWAAGLCVLIMAWQRDLGSIQRIVRQPRSIVLLTLAAYVLGLNWGVYIYAVDIGNVLEASLGYFINPLMMVLVGVVVLGEHLSVLQWSAVGLGALAVLVISFDYGQLPWIALTLATSFTIYGYIKKTLGGGIGAMQTMTIESVVLIPFAVGVLVWLRANAERLTFASEGWWHAILLSMLGIVTIAPLLWFTGAATRLPLTTMGMLQFLAPIGQFVVGVFIFKEAVSQARWIGFGLVWLALILLTVDTFRKAAIRRRRSRAQSLETSGQK